MNISEFAGVSSVIFQCGEEQVAADTTSHIAHVESTSHNFIDQAPGNISEPGDRKFKELSVAEQKQLWIGYASVGDMLRLQSCMDGGIAPAIINATDEKGRTALMLVASLGSIDTVRALCNVPGIDLNTKNKNGLTALDLLAAKRELIKVVRVLLRAKNINVNSMDADGKTALIRASFMGHEKIVEALLENPHIILNVADKNGKTALIWAAERGHIQCVSALRKKSDILLCAKDRMGDTALILAARNHHAKVVQELLSSMGPDEINAINNEGGTALQELAWNGEHECVDTLLQIRDTHPNTKDSWGFTPLMLAARKGHAKVVTTLLAKLSADELNATNQDSLTALHQAALSGMDEVVGILRKSGDIRVDAKDKKGFTALMLAARYGHAKVVQVLLDNLSLADVNDINQNGRGALHQAACSGMHKVIHLLRQVYGLPLNAKDKWGKTALMLAARAGYTEAVQELLLSLRAADVNAIDQDGSTALHHAACYGRHEVVQALLQVDGICSHAADKEGNTALMLAAREGHAKVIQALLPERSAAELNAANEEGLPALHQVACTGNHELVQALLQVPGIKIDARDREGNTVLMLAVKYGHAKVVQILLLSFSAAQVNAATDDGVTALQEAAYDGQDEIVHALLQVSGINLSAKEVRGFTALMLAARNGHLKVLQELLLHLNVDQVNEMNLYGRTALHQAVAYNDKYQLVDALLQVGGINLSAKDRSGNTALMLAARHGRTQAVQQLLSRLSAAEVNAINRYGRTALHHAVYSDNQDVIRALLQVHGISLNAQDAWGFTALMLAVKNGHAEIIGQLLHTPGVNVQAADNFFGYTVLMQMVEQHQTLLVESLLATQHIHAIDINAIGYDGQTALDIAFRAERIFNQANEQVNEQASENRSVNITRLLKMHGAKSAAELAG